MTPLIIIPTLNEAPNLQKLIPELFRRHPDIHILVIDADSIDQTPNLILTLKKKYPNLDVQQQARKDGFGGALRQGFHFALQGEFDPVITMDGDGAHGPEYIADFLERTGRYGLIIGSRYIDGVRVEGWRFRKLLVSKLANMYVSYLLVKPIWDFTSGFRCYQRSFLQSIEINALHDVAYIIQIQLLHLAYQQRIRIKEIPFMYRESQANESKISVNTKSRTMLYILKYRAPFLEIMRHLAYLHKEYERFVDEYEELANPPTLKEDGHFEVKEHYAVSVGLMAYNEEKIIGRCLDAVLAQQTKTCTIKEILVVSSGSTDRTNEIVLDYSNRYPQVRLIIQSRRLGKASAINEFLSRASCDIAVLESADTIPGPDTVEQLVLPFREEKVGMVGSHPMPVNDGKTFVGFSVRKLWALHHEMAMETPKCGELVAFRNIVSRIPKYTAVDEAAIEAILIQSGYELRYAPLAYVQNKGPETLRDFIRQRRRIASGHRHLKATMGHTVTTQKGLKILQTTLKLQRWTPREIWFMGWLILIETYSRFMGMIDFYLRDKNPFIWDISLTTKKM